MHKAIQDDYPDEHAHCFGCGRHNPLGIQLKSYLSEGYTHAQITPPKHYTGGVPNHLFGGMIAALLDCHGTASAAAFYRQKTPSNESQQPMARFVTANLNIDFLKPTPLDETLELFGSLISLDERKVSVSLTLKAGEITCANATMLAIKLDKPL